MKNKTKVKQSGPPSAPRTLTPRQLEILIAIRDGRRRDGYSPTLQELASQFGVSKVTVFEHVNALIKKGMLRRQSYKTRSLEVTQAARFPDERPTLIPLVGQVAAGVPIESYQTKETLDLETLFVTDHPRRAILVAGDSMIDEHICEGDLVIVEDRDNVRNGDTVVALVAGENTLKRFYREKDRIRLQPANGRYKPIYPRQVKIQGVVIGVIRRYKSTRRYRR